MDFFSQFPLIETPFSNLLKIRYPIIAAPMFLVSNEKITIATGEAGGIGVIPSLNWRSSEQFKQTLQSIQSKTQKPFGVNLIVHPSNLRLEADLEICIQQKVPLIITSLGNPKKVIEQMHSIGSHVFCDVTTLPYAQKVQDLGADGVIAVCSGAGGHAGSLSPFVFLPVLKKRLRIPIILAGGIANGNQIAAAFLLGASGVQVGTRFIASIESDVQDSYKKAILNTQAEEIVLTEKISGTFLSVIQTPFIKKQGLTLNPIEALLMKHPKTKKWMKLIRVYFSSKVLKNSASRTTQAEVWSAGQSVALIEEILTCEKIIQTLVQEYYESSSLSSFKL